jgi:phosphoglycerate kinase
MQKRTILDIDVDFKTVLVRVDFNVEMHDGGIADDSRIRASIPTISYLQEHNAKIVLCSHLGRPGGKVVESLRMKPIAIHLATLLDQNVIYVDDIDIDDINDKVRLMDPGDILMLENLRFNTGEESNDPDFCKAIGSLADVFVQDGFGVSHRAHASTEGITRFLPSVSGLLMDKEIDILTQLTESPENPLVLILGGAKISDKIGVIENFLDKVDTLLIGGGMAGTFLKAQGFDIGNSMVEDDKLQLATTLMSKASQNGIKLIIPKDVVVAKFFDPDAERLTVDIDEIPSEWYIMDIGHKTLDMFKSEVSTAKTILWNGPMGVFEFKHFSKGTVELAATLGSLKGVTTVLGGGSTAEAVESLGIADRITHVSTGGGATLEFLEGKELPGITALLDK